MDRTETTIEHATFTLDRTLQASPAQVFAAWADPAAKHRWLVDAGWTMPEYTADFRVGGREHSRFRPPGGTDDITSDTVYLDIVPDHRIVFAYAMSRADDAGPARPFSASLATVEITADGDATHLVFTEQGAFFDGEDKPAYRQAGWTDLLDTLAASLTSLTLTRVFDAPRDLVYAMWADPEHFKRWCLPAGFTAPDSVVDFRVGGEWRETLHGPDGTAYRSLSVFREIVPGERIVFTQSWLDPAGTPGPETTVTVTLRDNGPGRTELTFHQIGFATADSRDSHAAGWAETLAGLAAYLPGVDTTAA